MNAPLLAKNREGIVLAKFLEMGDIDSLRRDLQSPD